MSQTTDHGPLPPTLPVPTPSLSLLTSSCLALYLCGQVGFLFGVFSVVATAQFNIWQGSKQRELELSSTQLLYAIAFPQAAMCFFFAVVFEFSAVRCPLTPTPESSPRHRVVFSTNAGPEKRRWLLCCWCPYTHSPVHVE